MKLIMNQIFMKGVLIKMKYVVFSKKPGKHSRTILPKRVMTCKTVKFLVKEECSRFFPKKGFTWKHLMMADIIFADGILIKNIFGPIND